MRIPAAVLATIDAEASAAGISRAERIRQILADLPAPTPTPD